MKKSKSDAVKTPAHYTTGSLEVIDILRAKLTAEQLEGFLLGNILKYSFRFKHKNGAEDLRKAQVYLVWLIQHIEQR